MPLRAGFAQVDITPPMGTAKIGWLRRLSIQRVLDPLFARAGVIESDSGAVGIIELDLLSVRWTTTQQIRAAIAQRTGFNGGAILVSASHTHGGPACNSAGDVRRDGAYIATLVERCTEAFACALERRQPAEIGFGSCPEFRVASNRRVVMRDGTVQTHGSFAKPDSLYLEGPIDPEVAVIALRATDGRPLGAIVNFACHPVHHGGTDECTAGWPGVMAREMGERGWPVALFLQGAAGEMHTSNPVTGTDVPMETAGRLIAEDAVRVIQTMSFSPELKSIAARQRTVQLPYRNPSPEEIQGTIRGAQRFIDPAIYDRGMPALLERIRTRKMQPAEVQALRLGDHVLVSIPAEYFVRLGLRIKEEAYPHRALVAAYANGMIGYVPERESFRRGGYETTFISSSRMAPETGGLLAEAAVGLVKEIFSG